MRKRSKQAGHAAIMTDLERAQATRGKLADLQHELKALGKASKRAAKKRDRTLLCACADRAADIRVEVRCIHDFAVGGTGRLVKALQALPGFDLARCPELGPLIAAYGRDGRP